MARIILLNLLTGVECLALTALSVFISSLFILPLSWRVLKFAAEILQLQSLGPSSFAAAACIGICTASMNFVRPARSSSRFLVLASGVAPGAAVIAYTEVVQGRLIGGLLGAIVFAAVVLVPNGVVARILRRRFPAPTATNDAWVRSISALIAIASLPIFVTLAVLWLRFLPALDLRTLARQIDEAGFTRNYVSGAILYPKRDLTGAIYLYQGTTPLLSHTSLGIGFWLGPTSPTPVCLLVELHPPPDSSVFQAGLAGGDPIITVTLRSRGAGKSPTASDLREALDALFDAAQRSGWTPSIAGTQRPAIFLEQEF